MSIYMHDKKTGVMCGVNDYGSLFVEYIEHGEVTGYTMPFSDDNRQTILLDFYSLVAHARAFE